MSELKSKNRPYQIKSESVRKLSVDLWKSGLHGKEVGFKKQEEYMAKNRQFTKDMDIIGEIKEDGKDSGTIGVRESILNDRLVLKAFTGALGWIGSLEETVAREVSHSYLLKKNFPSYIVNASGDDYIIELQKFFGGLGKKEKFCFSIIFENNIMDTFIIEEVRMGLGDDWVVKTIDEYKVAHLDGKKLDIGGQWDISFYSNELAKDKGFVATLILFAASRKYHKDVEKRIGNLINERKKSKHIVLDNDEITLYRNPRTKR